MLHWEFSQLSLDSLRLPLYCGSPGNDGTSVSSFFCNLTLLGEKLIV